MAIHKILSSLVALTLVGNGLSVPTYTDITLEPLTRDEPIDANLLEKRIQEIIIGYRRVDPAEAEIYKNAGNTLTPSAGKGGLQLGQGVYTSDELGSWEGDKTKPSKNCVILANAEAFEKVSKAWIPRPSWWSAPLNMRPEKYLKGLSLNPAKTIRLGIVDVKGKETLQMMIPNELLNDKGGGLDLVVNCEDPDKKLELPTHKVDYSKWANVVGEKFAPAELEVQKLQEPADQLLKDSDAARVEAESATSVKDVEAASAKADTALKALQDIAQQMVEYTIKYNEWLFIENNLKPFSLYNQARANLLSTALRADEKTVEDYKVKFDAAVKEPITGNEAITDAEKLAADIKQVVDKVQKDLETKTALKSKGDSTPPLQLGKLARQDVAELKKLEAKVLESEVSATEQSLSKLSDIQKQVEAQLEKLPSPPESDPSDKDTDKGDKDTDKSDKDKGDKDTDKSDKDKGDKDTDTEKDTDSKDPGSSPSEQSPEKSKEAIQERTKVAQDVEKSSGSGWVGKALGGIAATAGTLLGAGGLYLASTAGAGGAAGLGGAALTGSFAVGELTISAAPISLEVSSAEVAEVLQEVVPEYAEKALNAVKTLRPAKLPKTPVRIPVLARKRQEGGESPELKRWRVAAVALLANQAIKDSLLEAFNQAQKEIASK
ncbi:hypothetical protein BBO_09011 [Beauveria brongniartii RCEF 3172]|uniref:Uncharacterized protein n=1 Tax=Beauveria brongniartii RCEF 3172 TaxID=1081107 RepID=A0A166WNG6_9HYPO|nr:hypothetical protein BBO_09011 [Beauveria brongniartii RCEF 3172]